MAGVSYAAPWWANLLHRLPHFDLRWEPTSSRFRPEDADYQQVPRAPGRGVGAGSEPFPRGSWDPRSQLLSRSRRLFPLPFGGLPFPRVEPLPPYGGPAFGSEAPRF